MILLHSPLVWVLGLVALQRLLELVIAAHNTRRLMQRGAREIGRAHYPLFVVLHSSWLVAIAIFTPLGTRPLWPLIAVFVVLQLCRVWVIATLGPYWTTRVITLDGTPLVRSGPFRFVRHPNYWVVVGEIAVLPLAFGDWQIALVWSVINAVLLRYRIGVEMQALSGREATTARPVPGLAQASIPTARGSRS